MTEVEKHFQLSNNYDVVMVRQHARELARTLGFGLTDQTRIATAVSEAARRALENRGSILFRVLTEGPRRGIECLCQGCQWVETPPGVPTGEVLGGLRGVERLMDDFELQPSDEEGQVAVVMRKWLKATLPGALLNRADGSGAS
jgi:serine/threonine-protein kinase RsbT